MVKLFGKGTPLKTPLSKISTIFTWLPPTVTDAFTPSLTTNKISCYHIHDMAVTTHFHHATEDETNQTFSAITMAVMPSTNTFSAECTVEDLNKHLAITFNMVDQVQMNYSKVAHIQQSKSQTVASNQTSGSICDA